MIIRSQEKRVIETFNDAYVSHNCTTVYVNGFKFGEYSTEEKANKVLDMIFIALENMESTFQMPQDEKVQ